MSKYDSIQLLDKYDDIELSDNTNTEKIVLGTKNKFDIVVMENVDKRSNLSLTPQPLLSGSSIPDFWFDATVDADITIATGVSAWKDHSGNGIILTQGAGSKQPTKVAGAINGLQAIRFDGLSQ